MANGYEKREKFILESGCPADVCEEAKVTVPVTVRAFSEIGDVDLHCCGKPVITKNSSVTPGCPDAVSKFTISQKMNIKIPIMFGADTDIGEGHVMYDLHDNNDNDDRDCDCKCGCKGQA